MLNSILDNFIGDAIFIGLCDLLDLSRDACSTLLGAEFLRAG